MNYNEFKNCVLDYVKHLRAEDETVRIEEIRKNNGTKLDGVTFCGAHCQVRPILYLEPFYERYQSGTPMTSVLEEIRESVEAAQENSTAELVHYTGNPEELTDRIVMRLINTERNRDLLSEVPHRSFLDLSVVYTILLDTKASGLVTTMIRNDQLCLWDINEEELYELALRNSPRLLPSCIRHLEEVLKELMLGQPISEIESFGEEDEEDEEQVICELGSGIAPMYLVSNEYAVHGASCILYPKLTEKLALRFRGDYYILPSSIHELIAVPDNGSATPEALSAMVRSINQTDVSPAEYLSDSVYHYEALTGALTVAG